MTENRLISVLMPVYNAQLYLNAAIDSVLNQDYTHWQLLLIDDFSTDNSADILKHYAQLDPRIQVATNTTKGIIPALQKAFEMSSGHFITRMDADDIMPVDKLSQFIKAAPNDSKTVITGKVRYFSDVELSAGYIRYQNWLNGLIDSQEHWKNVYRECVIASPNWMVNRQCFSHFFSFSDLVYPEDYDMVFRWLAAGFSIKSVSAITHVWREHPARTSRHAEAYQQKAFFELKTNWFIDLELENEPYVQVVGAGNKGKMVVKILEKRGVLFRWFDLDAANYGSPIFGHTIWPVSELKAQGKTIISVWPLDLKRQQEIENYLVSKGLILGKNAWLF